MTCTAVPLIANVLLRLMESVESGVLASYEVGAGSGRADLSVLVAVASGVDCRGTWQWG